MTTNKSFYAATLAKWATSPVKLGPQPSEAQFATAHQFGRPGKQSLGFAMALRDCGMTRGQMKQSAYLYDEKATTCFSHINDYVVAGTFTRDMNAPNKALKITLSDKGVKTLEARAAAQAATVTADKPAAKVAKGKAVKAKRASKARKITQVTAAENAAVEGTDAVEPMNGVSDGVIDPVTSGFAAA